MGTESVQVTVRPAHHGLDHVVQPGQGQVAGQLEPPPDRWLRSVQVEANAEATDLGGGRPQRRLGRLQLLEDAGNPPTEKGIEQSPALFGRGARQQLLRETFGVGRLGHRDQSTIRERISQVS